MRRGGPPPPGMRAGFLSLRYDCDLRDRGRRLEHALDGVWGGEGREAWGWPPSGPPSAGTRQARRAARRAAPRGRRHRGEAAPEGRRAGARGRAMEGLGTGMDALRALPFGELRAQLHGGGRAPAARAPERAKNPEIPEHAKVRNLPPPPPPPQRRDGTSWASPVPPSPSSDVYFQQPADSRDCVGTTRGPRRLLR